MTDENLPGEGQHPLTFASKNSKRRNKPAEYEDYALKIYKQPEDIINMKFDNAMQFIIPSVKKLDLVPLVTVNKIKRFTGATHGGNSKPFFTINKSTKNCIPNSINVDKPDPSTGYGVLQQLMLRYYMEKYKTLLPTNAITYDARSLFNIPNARRRQYNFKRLIKDLAAKDFVTERFSYSYRNFISEDPKIVMDRIFYFEKLGQYRASGRNIINIVRLENLLITIPPVKEVKQCYTNILNRNRALKVIQKEFIPFLPANSVVILDYDLRIIKIKTPKPYSRKESMQKWLKRIGVSYNDDAQKAELYSLILKHRLKMYIYYLERTLKKHGHTLLWKPKVSNICCFHGILTLMYEKLKLNECDASTVKEQYINTIENTSLETWKDYDEFIAVQEKRCFSEDLTVMEIVDNIQTAARNLRVVMEEIKENVSINNLRRILNTLRV